MGCRRMEPQPIKHTPALIRLSTIDVQDHQIGLLLAYDIEDCQAPQAMDMWVAFLDKEFFDQRKVDGVVVCNDNTGD